MVCVEKLYEERDPLRCKQEDAKQYQGKLRLPREFSEPLKRNDQIAARSPQPREGSEKACPSLADVVDAFRRTTDWVGVKHRGQYFQFKLLSIGGNFHSRLLRLQ